MRSLILTCAVLLLPGCSTLGIEKPNCYESVAVTKIALTEGYKSTKLLLDDEKIDADTATDALMAFDSADAAADTASSLCAIDEKSALDYLDAASDLIGRATDITRMKDL